jgi:hypothetical protein
VKVNSAYTELLELVRALFGQYTDILRRLFKADLAYVAQGAFISKGSRPHDIYTYTSALFGLA